MGPLKPLFLTSYDVSSGFQSQSGQPYLNWERLHDVHSARFTSSVTPSYLLTASMAASCLSPHACFSRGRMPGLIEGHMRSRPMP